MPYKIFTQSFSLAYFYNTHYFLKFTLDQAILSKFVIDFSIYSAAWGTEFYETFLMSRKQKQL